MISFDNFNFENVIKKQDYNLHEISDNDIAVIGLASRLPKSSSIEDIWNNISQDKNCIDVLSEHRIKDIKAYESMFGEDEIKEYPKGAYLDKIDEFDYKFFHISPNQARLMDPHHRIFLETVWNAIEDAGYSKEMLQGTNTGVYAGFNPRLEYKQMISALDQSVLSDALMGNLPSSLTGLVSYYLDLCGPNLTINTACSSSLVALHVACQALKNKECSIALCGSIRISLNPLEDYKNSDIGIATKNDYIKVFDDDSDGTGGGEGCIVFLLKPLNVALEQRDHIYAVIKGSSINSDGHSASISAPNPLAQKKLIIQAWNQAGIRPETVSYIETHGTGTQLGDSIEFDGLQKAFELYTNRKQFCAIGSIKSNYGHLDTAAGLLGILKCILSLQHKKIPGNRFFVTPSRKIDFEASALYVNQRLRDWEVVGGNPRRCGVSSFGLSGTNAHVVMEEALPQKHVAANDKEYRLLALSAKGKENLLCVAEQYYNYIRRYQNTNLDDLCFTANTGRSYYEYRLAIVFCGREDLENKLQKVIQSGLGEIEDSIYYRMITDNVEDENAKDEYQRILEDAKQGKTYFSKDNNIRFAQLFVSGYSVDMKLLFYNLKPYRISLPGYQFSKERCWFEATGSKRITRVDTIQSERQQNKTKIEKKTLPHDKEVYSQLIKNVWSDVLGYGDFQSNDDYFALGGDSLQAIKIVNELNETLGATLNVYDLLTHPTIMALANVLYENMEQEVQNDAIKPALIKDYYEVSSTQKRFYIANQIENKTVRYNMTNAVAIEGNLDFERLQNAFRRLIDRHEILRTSFLQIGHEVYQKVNEKVDFNLEYVEDAKLDVEYLMQNYRHPFDLEKAPLVRVKLVKRSEEQYILLYDIHHIVFDGASIGIFIQELLGLYFNRTLPKMRVQYKDYVLWFLKNLERSKMQEHERFWLEWLKGDLPKTIIPYTKHPHQPRTYSAKSLWCCISEEETRCLSALASQNNTTLYVILLSVVGLLLSIYTGDDKVVLGTPVVGRNHRDLENLIGSFINTLVIKLDLDMKESFQEYIVHVKDIMLGALTHQEYPYEKIVEKLNIYDNSNSIYNVVFAYHTNLRGENYEIDEIKLIENEYEVNVATDELTIDAVEVDGVIKLNFVYSDELYEESTAMSLIKSFQNIISFICEKSEIPLGQINCFTKDDEKQYIEQYCRGDVEALENKTIVQMFHETVAKYEFEIAVIGVNGCLTYKQLDQESNKLASILRSYDVSNGIVGIWMPRKKELLVAMIGVLKAGYAYIPIDPTYPKDRIAYMLANSKVDILLTSTEVKDAQSYQIRCIYMDKFQEYERIEENTSIDITIHPEALAYIIYTSGSTGLPNGVKISHRALYNFVQGIQRRILFQEKSTFLASTTVSFDIFVLETLYPLANGHRIVLASERQQRDIDALSNLIEEYHVNVMQATPSRINLMLSFESYRYVIPGISYLLIGGERFPENLLDMLKEVYGGKLYNMYGPTETTIWSSVKCLDGADEITIGKPLLNTNFYIFNKNKHLVPPGCYGELYVGGAGLSSGYLYNDELTKSRFIANPLNENEIIYKTGDIAKICENGELYLVGRDDSQVKLNGYRIELGEIETVLAQIDGIREVVVKKESKDGREYLCGYFTSDSEADISKLKYELAKKVPYYMIPKYLFQMESFAKTPNGKKDRKALKAPMAKVSSRGVQSNLENRIIEILQEVTNLSSLSVADNFFDLGMDSITLIQFHKQLKDQLKCDIDITDLFNNSSIDKVVHLVEEYFNPQTKKSMNTLCLAKEYFSTDQKNGDRNTLSYSMSGDSCGKLLKVAEVFEISVDKLLFCIQIIMTCLVKDEKEGAVYYSTSKDEQIRIKEFLINEDIVVEQNLIKTLQMIILKEKESQQYNIATMVNNVSNLKGNEAVVGFCTSSEKKECARLLFDIMVSVEIQPQYIQINTDLSKRMNKDEIKRYFAKYIKIIQVVLKQMLDE